MLLLFAALIGYPVVFILLIYGLKYIGLIYDVCTGNTEIIDEFNCKEESSFGFKTMWHDFFTPHCNSNKEDFRKLIVKHYKPLEIKNEN